MAETLPIGEFLVRKELISPRALAQVLKEQPAKRQRLISMLILRAELEIDDGATVLSEQLGYCAAFERHLERRDLKVAKLLPAALCAQHAIMALGKTAGGRLIVGARDPSPALAAALEQATQLSIELAVVPAILIERLVKATFSAQIEPAASFPAGLQSMPRARSVSALYADTQPPKAIEAPATPTPTPRQPTAKVVIPERKSGGVAAVTDFDSAPILLDKPKQPSGPNQAIPIRTEPEKTQQRLPVQRPPAPPQTTQPIAKVAQPRSVPPDPEPDVPTAYSRASRPPTEDPDTRSPGPRPGTEPPGPPIRPSRPAVEPGARTQPLPAATPPRSPPPMPKLRPPTEPPAPPPLRAPTPLPIKADGAPLARIKPPGKPAPAPPPPIRSGDEVTRPGVIHKPAEEEVTITRHQTPTAPAPNQSIPEDARAPDRRQSPTRPAPNVPIPDDARRDEDHPDIEVTPLPPPQLGSIALADLAVEAGATASDPAVTLKPPPRDDRPAERPRSVSEMFGDLLDEPPTPPPLPEPSQPLPKVPRAATSQPEPRVSAPSLPPPPPQGIRAPTEPTVTSGPPKPPPAPGTGSIEAVCKEIERAISRATADRVLITFAGSRFKAALLVMIADGVARGARGQGPRLQAVQTIVLPLEAPSILQTACETRELSRDVPSSPTQDRIAELIGSHAPLAVPVLVDDAVVAVLVVGDVVEPGVADADLQKVVLAFATAYKRLYKAK